MALNPTLLRVPSPLLSSELIHWRVDKELPMYTLRVVSKSLPSVEIVTPPEEGAVQDHQTELPADCPACRGSSASRVAPMHVPVALISLPVSGLLLAKSSFSG